MPITFEVDRERKRIHAIAEGTITYPDVEEHLSEENGVGGLGYSELVDARHALLKLTSGDVRQIVGLLRGLRLNIRLGPTAILVTSDYAFGLMSLLGMLVDDVCDSQSDANFSIAVEPGYMPAGTVDRARRLGGFSSTMSPDDVAAVRLTVAAGDYSTTILATALSLSGGMCRCHSYGTWNWAAVMAEPQLDTWVRSNYDHLIALRNSGK